MGTVNDRIREFRLSIGLSQLAFGKRIHIGQTSVSWCEKPGSNVPASTIHAIALEYGVNEQWLLTGEGPQRSESGVSAELYELCNQLLAGEADSFRSALADAIAQLSDEKCEMLADFVLDLAAGIRKEREEKARADPEAEARAEAAEFYRQRLLQKKAAAKSSASGQSESA